MTAFAASSACSCSSMPMESSSALRDGLVFQLACAEARYTRRFLRRARRRRAAGAMENAGDHRRRHTRRLLACFLADLPSRLGVGGSRGGEPPFTIRSWPVPAAPAQLHALATAALAAPAIAELHEVSANVRSPFN